MWCLARVLRHYWALQCRVRSRLAVIGPSFAGKVSRLGEHQEVFVSVLTKKQPINASGKFRASAALTAAQQAAQQAHVAALQAAQQAQAAAQQAAPLAKTASDGAIAWATPKVDAARAWAAPQLEQSAHAISDNLAPMISSALMAAAHKIEVPKRKSRQRRRLLTGSMLIAAAAGLAAVLVMRLRQQPQGFSGAGAVGPAEPGPDSARSEAGTGLGFET